MQETGPSQSVQPCHEPGLDPWIEKVAIVGRMAYRCSALNRRFPPGEQSPTICSTQMTTCGTLRRRVLSMFGIVRFKSQYLALPVPVTNNARQVNGARVQSTLAHKGHIEPCRNSPDQLGRWSMAFRDRSAQDWVRHLLDRQADRTFF